MPKGGRRIVALVDVLGASAALAEKTSSNRFSEALSKILSPIVRERNEIALVVPHLYTGEMKEIDVAHPVHSGGRVTTISDSIVISVPCGPRLNKSEQISRILDCIHSVYLLQRGLLNLGVLTRGGVAIGNLIHQSHLAIGEGLVRAYRIERDEARYPRAVIDKPIIEMLLRYPHPDGVALFSNRVAHLVRQDKDDIYFVDYLSIDPVAGSLVAMKSSLVDEIVNLMIRREREKDERIKQKLDWFYDYLGESIHFLQSRGEYVDHAGNEFSSIYVRTAENLITWLDQKFPTRDENS